MKSIPCLLLFLSAYVASTAQSTQPDTWVPNGRVRHMTQGDGKVFLAGDFNWVGEAYSNNAPVLNTDLSLDSTYPKVTFPIEEAIPDDAGGWYTRGSGQIAHIKADKTVEILPINFNSSGVYTMAKSGNILYFGGVFTAVNGTTRNRVAAVDLTDNSVTSWDPNSNGTVYSVKVFGSTVYVGGSFSTIGGATRYKIAAIDATTGAATSWNVNVTASFGYVLDIVPTAGAVYFGGNFANVASAIPSRQNFAAVNATTGALLTFNPRPDDIVYDLLLDGTTLYIAGKYYQIAGSFQYGLTSFDTGTGSITTFNVDFPDTYGGPVITMAVDGTKLFVGGDFLSVNGIDQPKIAVLDKTTGAVQPTVDRKLSDRVNTISIVGTKVFVGSYNLLGITGDFNNQFMAALDEQTGQGLGWIPQPPAIPNGWYIAETHLNFQDNRLYYWRDIEEPMDGLSKSLIGALNSDDGTTDPGFNVDVQGTVTAWTFTSNTLYLAGDFTQVNGTASTNFAAVSLPSGALLPFTEFPSVISGADVRSMAVSNNVVYAAGYFEFVDGGITRTNLAAWDATTGEILPWAPQITLPMYSSIAIGAIHNGKVYITGGVLQRVSAITGEPDSWTPDYFNTANSTGEGVQSIIIQGNYAYIVGYFSPGLARVGIASGRATAWQPDIYDVYDSEGEANTIVTTGSKLYAGGNCFFPRIDGHGQYLAQFDLPIEPANAPPQILSAASALPTDGVVSIDLLPLISDPDDNLDLATLNLLNNVSYQGAAASIDVSFILTLDYGGPFSGTDSVYLEVCDLLEACTQQTVFIELGSSELTVYNAVSPNGDGKNDLFTLLNINPDNKVTIFDRWGSVVFNIENYDNQTRVFQGLSNTGTELPPGTYYYRIDFPDGQATRTGYLSLRR